MKIWFLPRTLLINESCFGASSNPSTPSTNLLCLLLTKIHLSYAKAVSKCTFIFTQKHKNIPFPPQKMQSGWRSTVQGSRHTWTLKKSQFHTQFLSHHSIIPPTCWLSCWLSCWLLCCCRVVVVVFVYFVAALPTLPPLPPSARCRRRHCHWLAWRLMLSHCLGHQIERRKNQEQKYTMALVGCQTQIKTQQPTKNSLTGKR